MAEHYLTGGTSQGANIHGATTGFGMAGSNAPWSSREGGGVNIDARGAATTALKVCSAAMSGMSAFAASSSAAGPAGMIAGTALGLISEGLQGGFEAYDAQKTKAELLRCLDAAEAVRDAELANVIEHCMSKSDIKFRAGVSKATLVGQPGAMLYRTGKAIYKTAKGTKGIGRHERATKLIDWAKNGSPSRKNISVRVIRAICQQGFDEMIQTSLESSMKS